MKIPFHRIGVIAISLSTVLGCSQEKPIGAIGGAVGPVGASGLTTVTLQAASPSAKSLFNVRDFGAQGDGVAVDSPAVNRTIEAAAAAGGGTVHFPAGKYLCYSIRLKSNIALYLDSGCTIIAATTGPAGRYDAPEENAFAMYQDGGHSHWHDALIWGENLHDVSILGPGLIDGRSANGRGLSRGDAGAGAAGRGGVGIARRNGPASRPATTEGSGPSGRGPFGGGFNGGGFGGGRNGPATMPIANADTPGNGRGGNRGGGRTGARGATSGPTTRGSGPPGQADKAISLKLCTNVTLRDFSILNAGHFGILATGVDKFTIDNLKIDSNRDGMDIDCCHDVRISNCSVNSPMDDGICLKSSYALGTLRATENVAVTHCQVSGYDVGTFLDGTCKRTMNAGPDRYGPVGRIKLGSESNGGYKHIAISDCAFIYCRGLALETVDGGPLEDITATNLTMQDVGLAPIFIRLGNRARGPKGTPVADCKGIRISNVIANNVEPRFGCVIAGMNGESINDVRLENLRFQYWGGGTAEMNRIDPPEADAAYPEPFMFNTLPSYGFFIRHVSGLEMNNVHLSYLTPEARTPFSLMDVKHAKFNGIEVQRDPATPIFALRKVEDFTVSQSTGVPDGTRAHVDSGSY